VTSFYDFLSLKNDVNASLVWIRIQHRSGSVYFLASRIASGSVSQRYGSEDPDPLPDPYQYVTDFSKQSTFHFENSSIDCVNLKVVEMREMREMREMKVVEIAPSKQREDIWFEKEKS
jgi:hypothetical protein